MRLRHLLGSAHRAYAECVHKLLSPFTSLPSSESRGVCEPASSLLLRILKKALAGLPAAPTCVHHADEQRARAILRITQAIFQHAHDVQADIEPDEIRQRQWTHWMRHSELEDLVDCFRGGDSFHNG